MLEAYLPHSFVCTKRAAHAKMDTPAHSQQKIYAHTHKHMHKKTDRFEGAGQRMTLDKQKAFDARQYLCICYHRENIGSKRARL